MDPTPLRLPDAIARASARGDFTEDEMAALMGQIMDGEATPAQIAALLIALRMKGETVSEVVGAARALRARALPIALPAGAWVDTCGTGGDGSFTLNVSTLAALVAAACGARVAKHGNRAQTSRAGSADLLEALGVNVAASVPQVERCLREVGLGFLFAPAFHGATARAGAVRREIGGRTLFNLLGPMTNPAGVRRQVVGVFSAAWVRPVCEALGRLGAEHALVVHGTLPGADGQPGALDEVSPYGETHAAEWRDGVLRELVLTPASFGLDGQAPASARDAGGSPHGTLAGGDPAHNAVRALALLGGAAEEHGGAAHRAVVMAAACALYVAGHAADLPAAAARADASLRAGQALHVLGELRRVSHG